MTLLILCAATLALAEPSKPTQGPASESIHLAAARRAFDEARAASDTDRGRLWGRELYGPMLFVDRDTRFVVANQKDGQGELAEKDGLFTGYLPEKENVANTAYSWAGVTWTMIIWPLPSDRYARTRLMMHECFHRIQSDLGLSGSNPSNSHLDSQEGRTWLRLEWRALAQGLMHRGAARRKAVEDALVFRACRRLSFERAAKDERALEMNEGLAEYTAYKLGGWPAGILADRAAVNLERQEGSSSFVRSFAYACGPAYGILLDEAGLKWRKNLRPTSDFGDLLAKAFEIELPRDLKEEAHRRAAQYDAETVMAEEKKRADAQQAMIARHRARFVDGPVLLLPLGTRLSYAFNPRAADALGDLGTVYLTARVTDVWGVLEVSDGVLMVRDAAGNMSQAKVPAPGDPSGSAVKGDGWTLALEDGWQLVPGVRPGDYVVVQGKRD